MARGGKPKNPEQGTSAEAGVWRVGAYIRLSKEDGGAESESVTNQRKIIEDYLETSFSGSFLLADYYIDDGLTGTDDSRLEFMRMIADIERGKVNCVLCKTLARAFRNYSDQGYYLEVYFPMKKVRFICVGDPAIDTHTHPEAITGLEVPITGLLNDRYASKTSSDVRRTFNTKRKRGEYIGAFPPYGYLKDPKDKNHLVLDHETAALKREICGWILRDGMSLSGIARRLNGLGIPNPTADKRAKGFSYFNPHAVHNDGLWSGSTVKRMLLDKVNLGHMVQGKQRVISYKVHRKEAVPKPEWFFVENTHEATFTQDEYDLLERTLTRDTRVPNGASTVHLFSGFLRCGGCGKALQRKQSRRYVYYVCRTHAEKLKSRCSRHTLRADWLEEAVLCALQAQLTLQASMGEILVEMGEAPRTGGEAERVELCVKERQKELDKAHSISDGLYADWKTGIITQEDYSRMKARYQRQIDLLQAALASLYEDQRKAQDSTESENHGFSDFLFHRTLRSLHRVALVEFVDSIHVHEGKAISLTYRFRDELAWAITRFEADH